ncbi:MAG: SCP2 sterol-binding domain-containing protein [Zoogloeaceae bacterium]|nr:SCP2 sterol-binding domain-containing protein [Zoogloeaceae bacterium]
MQLPLTPVALLLRSLPDHAHARLFSAALNHLMKGQSLAGGLADLDGRRICLQVSDAGRAPVFIVRDGRLAACAGAEWDVRISGKLADFALLASRREDPDTLFFQRRLAIEGDTATGLHIKNLLDALEFDVEAHCTAVLGTRVGGVAAGLARAVQSRLPAIRFS